MLANSLRKRRIALGLTQNELAGRFGVSRQTVNNWEQRRTRVPGWCSDQLRWIEQEVQARNAKARDESLAPLPQRSCGVKRGPYHVHKLKLLDNA
jgi:hypothetical protein